MTRRRAALLAPCLALALTACGGDSGSDGAGAAGGRVEVAAAFYPLQYLAERVGGEGVAVTGLTSPGVEPHDLELTPQQVAGLSEDDLVLYLAGFQPAVDDAVDQQASEAALDLGAVTPLEPGFVPLEEGELAEDEEGEDPHVWLDPLRYADLADAVAARLGELDADRAQEFMQAAGALRGELEALDAEYRAALADCDRRQLVTSHNAFGYLARAYDLEQVAITGLTPDAEASSGRLAEVADYARANGVTTVFFEELVSPDVARSLADEVGATAVELSPLEGAPEEGDYFTAMRANLAALTAALGCSTA